MSTQFEWNEMTIANRFHAGNGHMALQMEMTESEFNRIMFDSRGKVTGDNGELHFGLRAWMIDMEQQCEIRWMDSTIMLDRVNAFSQHRFQEVRDATPSMRSRLLNLIKQENGSEF